MPTTWESTCGLAPASHCGTTVKFDVGGDCPAARGACLSASTCAGVWAAGGGCFQMTCNTTKPAFGHCVDFFSNDPVLGHERAGGWQRHWREGRAHNRTMPAVDARVKELLQSSTDEFVAGTLDPEQLAKRREAARKKARPPPPLSRPLPTRAAMPRCMVAGGQGEPDREADGAQLSLPQRGRPRDPPRLLRRPSGNHAQHRRAGTPRGCLRPRVRAGLRVHSVAHVVHDRPSARDRKQRELLSVPPKDDDARPLFSGARVPGTRAPRATASRCSCRVGAS